jgi:hypothetical protein
MYFYDNLLTMLVSSLEDVGFLADSDLASHAGDGTTRQ